MMLFCTQLDLPDILDDAVHVAKETGEPLFVHVAASFNV
jgi:hypothetical protein